MARMEYTACFKQGGTYGPFDCIRYFSFDDDKDHREEVIATLKASYEDVPGFSIVSVNANSQNAIDYALIDRMKATRLICELGRHIRAEAKIKNRQPLRKAYVAFSNKEVSDYMIYLDGAKQEYASIIQDELNVFDVEWVAEDTNRFFDYSLKPNFRTLGKKGFGKQAQVLKIDLVKMGNEESNALYAKLKAGETVVVLGVPLTFEDVESGLRPKPGYAAASDKVGAIILDTKLDDFLLDRGFVAEFRSEMQQLRKDAKLQLTDRIAVEVLFEFDRSRNSVANMVDSLKKTILATDMTLLSLSEFDKFNKIEASELSIEGEKVYVRMCKVV